MEKSFKVERTAKEKDFGMGGTNVGKATVPRGMQSASARKN